MCVTLMYNVDVHTNVLLNAESKCESASGPVAIPDKRRQPRRPGVGTEGRQIRVWTNFFKVKIPSDLTLFHYDVVILPDVPRAIKRKVMQVAVVKYKTKFSGQFPVFDGEKSLYCYKKMRDKEAGLYTMYIPSIYLFIR